jgi:hypothetical protein
MGSPRDAGSNLALNDTVGGGILANVARFLDKILNFNEHQSTQQQ